MALDCDNNRLKDTPSVIRWPETRELGRLVDAAATSLNTPGYSPLLTDNTTPFPLADVVDWDFRVRFNLSPASALPPGPIGLFEPPGPEGSENAFPVVVDNRLMHPVAEGLLVLPEPLRTLSEQGDLYFLHEVDECLCGTMFKVLYNSLWAFHYLDTVEKPNVTCACQNMRVPQVNEKLDYSQKIIPAGYALTWAYRSGPEEEEEFRDIGPRCVEELPGHYKVEYLFRTTMDFAVLFPPAIVPLPRLFYMKWAQRGMKGKFIWPIRRKWFQAVKDNVDFILDCTRHGGLRADKIYENTTNDFLPAGCTATFEDLQWTLFKTDYPVEEPGCMTEPGKLPWDEVTCLGELCGALADGGALGNDFLGGQQPVGAPADTDPLVYCETMKQFEALLTNLDDDGGNGPLVPFTGVARLSLSTVPDHFLYSPTPSLGTPPMPNNTLPTITKPSADKMVWTVTAPGTAWPMAAEYSTYMTWSQCIAGTTLNVAINGDAWFTYSTDDLYLLVMLVGASATILHTLTIGIDGNPVDSFTKVGNTTTERVNVTGSAPGYAVIDYSRDLDLSGLEACEKLDVILTLQGHLRNMTCDFVDALEVTLTLT